MGNKKLKPKSIYKRAASFFFLSIAIPWLGAWISPSVDTGPGPGVGPVTSMPLPRFESLRSNMVYLRVGPGFQYPVKYVFHWQNLPVEVIGEFDVWRHVVMPDGSKGWVHEALLHGLRTFIVINGQHVLRSAPEGNALPNAYLDQGAIGVIRSCQKDAGWCQVSIGHRSGWLKRMDFWGSFYGEKIK